MGNSVKSALKSNGAEPTMHLQEQSTLFSKIPQEIRDKIYRCALSFDRKELRRQREQAGFPTETDEKTGERLLVRSPNALANRTPLLRACRRVYDEGYHIYTAEISVLIVATSRGVIRSHFFDDDDEDETINAAKAREYLNYTYRLQFDPEPKHCAMPSDSDQTLAEISRGLSSRIGIRVQPVLDDATLILDLAPPCPGDAILALFRTIVAAKDLQLKNLQVHIVYKTDLQRIELSYFVMIKRAFQMFAGVKSCSVTITSGPINVFRRAMDRALISQLVMILEHAILSKPPFEDTDLRVLDEFLEIRSALWKHFTRPVPAGHQSRARIYSHFIIGPGFDENAARWIDTSLSQLYGYTLPSLVTCQNASLKQRLNDFAIVRESFRRMFEELESDGIATESVKLPKHREIHDSHASTPDDDDDFSDEAEYEDDDEDVTDIMGGLA